VEIMSGTAVAEIRVADARGLAKFVLRNLPERWQHTVSVAARATQVASTVQHNDRATLVAAAWLHDIGYAGPLRDTGFHPVDGARFLDRYGWPARISALVAHHSGARFVARVRGLEAELDRYHHEESAVSDALTYADQTTGPHGERLPIKARLAEVLRRHGPASPQAIVHHQRAPYLLAVAERVERRRSAGRRTPTSASMVAIALIGSDGQIT
jgi:putative nucleotidyltransferase with HDIG domain